MPLNDIATEQGKIGGAAQKRLANGGMLHHVTMSYDIDADKMVEVLRIGKEKLSDKGTTSAKKRVDPLRRQTGMARAEIVAAMMDVFAERYGATPSELTDAELDAARHRVDVQVRHRGVAAPRSLTARAPQQPRRLQRSAELPAARAVWRQTGGYGAAEGWCRQRPAP